MGRRKRKNISPQRPHFKKRSSSESLEIGGSSDSALEPVNPQLLRHCEKVLPGTTAVSGVTTSLSLVQFETGSVLRKKRSAMRLRAFIQRLALFLAALNWAATFIACGLLGNKGAENPTAGTSLELAVCLISTVQIGIVVSYWSVSARYLESIRRSMNPHSLPFTQFSRDPAALFCCAAECVYHCFVSYPGIEFSITFSIFNSNTEIQSEKLFAIAILIRNYHTVRLLHWLSPYTTARTIFISHLVSIEQSVGFILRSCLADYGLWLLSGAYCTTVFLSGLTVTTMEDSSGECLSVSWNSLWSVAITQITVGYGDCHPITFAGQMAMIISCFFGIFALGLLNAMSSGKVTMSLSESNMYSEVAYARYKRYYLVEAVVLLQRWWRLMKSRKKYGKKGEITVAFYSQLREYRQVLTKCQLAKDPLFDRQVAAFQSSICTKIRRLNEYLNPVLYAHSIVLFRQVQDLVRYQYRISVLCERVGRLRKRCKVKPTQSSMSLTLPEGISDAGSQGSCSRKQTPRTDLSSQRIARNRQEAFQNVRSRLVRLPASSRAESSSHSLESAVE